MNDDPRRNGKQVRNAGLADALPPHNIEAEEGTLGSMLQENQTIPEVMAVLTADDLYRDSHQIIYRGICDLYELGGPVDLLTLADELARHGDLDRVGGVGALAEIQNGVPHAANACYYAGIVRQKAIARRLLEAHAEAARAILSNTLTAEQMVDSSESLVFAAGSGLAPVSAITLSDAVGLSLERLEERRRTGRMAGIPSGYADLDSLLDGFKPGRFYVIAARPAIGKSTLAFDVACNAALTYGAQVRFVSLEMDQEELADRYLAARAMLDGQRLRDPRNLTAAEERSIANAACLGADGQRLVIDDTGGQTLQQIAAQARRQKARDGLGLLFVDYLQLVDSDRRKGENREQEVARIARRLKTLAKQLHVPVVACCQLNRAPEARPDRMPRLADLRESGDIEASADVVILIHRPDFYDATARPGEADLLIRKHRGGPSGVVKLMFNMGQTRFYGVAHVPEPAPGTPPAF